MIGFASARSSSGRCSRGCRSVTRRARACSPGSIYLPAYGLLALPTSLPLAVAAAVGIGRRREPLVRPAQLGGAGGGARRRARTRARRDLVRPSRLARDRAAARRAALRRRGAAPDLRRRGGRSGPRRPGRRRSRGPRGPRAVGSERGPDATAAQRSSRRSSSTCDGSKPSMRRIAPAAADRGARGHEADELRADHLGAARRRLGGDPRDDLVQRGRLPVLDVHRHLHEPEPRAARARAPGRRGKPPPRSRTVAAISTRGLERPRRFTLNAISGLRAPTRTAPAAGSSAIRAEVGRELAASTRRRCELLDTAAPVEGRAAGGRLVEEDGQPRARRSARRASARRAARARGPPARSGRSGRRRRRRSADARPSWRRRSIRSRATADGRRRAPRPARGPAPTTVNTERLWSASLWTSSRRTRAASAPADRVDRRRLAALGEVRHRLERQHAPTLRADPVRTLVGDGLTGPAPLPRHLLAAAQVPRAVPRLAARLGRSSRSPRRRERSRSRG